MEATSMEASTILPDHLPQATSMEATSMEADTILPDHFPQATSMEANIILLIIFHKLRAWKPTPFYWNIFHKLRACMEANTINLLDHLPQATSMEANTILLRGGFD
ncbi:hypothetical protein NC653_040185 [Populus alba x Populus x berolinensis]|uniref:Uncharacterized protein n=1 Tax=Populus alba x Populus x berolinensis TaxID=444605 RepID=A0AAD6LD27_9ROSI|nr:hypothetical protein NC653_040185 [Populus alba x Populus x berolinensis]